jgi:hypothetical protein
MNEIITKIYLFQSESYRAGKYYNYDRGGDKIAIDLILNSGMIGTTGVTLDFIYQGIARNRISLAPLTYSSLLKIRYCSCGFVDRIVTNIGI